MNMRIGLYEISVVFLCLLVSGLGFVFSMDSADACSGTDTYVTTIYTPEGNVLRQGSESINPTGGTDCNSATTNDEFFYVNCQMAGNYTADVECDGCGTHAIVDNTTILFCYSADGNKFDLKNTSGQTIAAFDEKGYLYLRGLNQSNQASLSAPPNSFVLKDPSGATVAFIANNGSLHHTGSLTQGPSNGLSAPVNSFIITNRTGQQVAYIDSSGNVVVSGKMYLNWTGQI